MTEKLRKQVLRFINKLEEELIELIKDEIKNKNRIKYNKSLIEDLKKQL